VLRERGGEFLEKIRLTLEAVFEKYPPCIELTEAVEDSYWAKIPCCDGNYFAFGVISVNDKRRLCYAVPAKNGLKPDDDGFFRVKTRKSDFWVLSQIGESGCCLKGEAENPFGAGK